MSRCFFSNPHFPIKIYIYTSTEIETSNDHADLVVLRWFGIPICAERENTFYTFLHAVVLCCFPGFPRLSSPLGTLSRVT